MNQRGFIALPMMAWGAIAAGVLILGLGFAVKIQTARLDSVRQEYAAFVAQVDAQGKAAAKAARAKEAADKQAKERADRENANTRRNLADIYAAYRSLRDSRAAGGGVSAAPTLTPSADRTCFDSAELVGAIRSLETGILAITEQGDKAIADLSTAKAWAK